MYAAILSAGALGYALNVVFIVIEKRIVHWRKMSVVISPKIDLPPETPFVPGPPAPITIRGLTKYFAGWPLYETSTWTSPSSRSSRSSAPMAAASPR
jgi:hypothetical protein